MPETIFAEFTPDEETHVRVIVDRAVELFNNAGFPCRGLDVRIDLSAAHLSCPLDLAALAEFDDANLAHDVAGIYRHLNRITGELMDCFVPRCAFPERSF